MAKPRKAADDPRTLLRPSTNDWSVLRGPANQADAPRKASKATSGSKAPGRRPRTWDEYHQWMRDLDDVRCNSRIAFDRGRNWAALFDAVCAETRAVDGDTDTVQMPRWVADGLVDALTEGFRRFKSPRGRGRHARWLEAYRADAIDWHRFNQVLVLLLGSEYRDDRSRTQKRVDRIRRHRDGGSVDYSTPHPWAVGSAAGDLTAFEAASLVLATSGARGSAPAMRKSFDKVSKAVSRGEGWRFYRSWKVVLKGLGRSIENAPRRGRAPVTAPRQTGTS